MGKGAFPWPGFAVLVGAVPAASLCSSSLAMQMFPAPGGSQVQLLWCDCHFTLQSRLPRWNVVWKKGRRAVEPLQQQRGCAQPHPAAPQAFRTEGWTWASPDLFPSSFLQSKSPGWPFPPVPAPGHCTAPALFPAPC